jgi:hypothetical protein
MKTDTRVFSLFALACGLTVGMFLSGCDGEKKMTSVPIGALEEYRDPVIGFHIMHPTGWVMNAEVGRARFYNAPEVDKKFLDPTGAYPVGVEIAVNALKTAEPAAAIKQIKSDLAAVGPMKPEEPVTVAGLTGSKIPYSFNYGGKNIVHGHHILIATDTIVFHLSFAGYGDTYQAYTATFDTVLKSFQLPRPAEKGRDATLPSEILSDFNGKMFTFSYPDNFNFTNPSKGKYDEVVELRGVRQDCSIRFDVFGAKGLQVDKVFEQNKGKYAASGSGKATVGGQPAMYLTYSVTPVVERRFYFVVRNDKVIRITMDWFKAQRDVYIPVYEKVIASVTFK